MRIAITGGIAEGKSTVLGYLEGLGFSTVSADEIAHEAFESPEVQSRLAALIGEPGLVSRDQMRQAMSFRPGLRRDLNRIMHARIWKGIEESGAEFCEVPLLVEACLQDRFDEVWVCTCGPTEQLRRLTTRVGRAEAVRLLSVQLPTAAKLPFADEVIRTNQPEGSVLREVRERARERV